MEALYFLSALDGMRAEEQMRLREVVDYSLHVQHTKTLSRAQAFITRLVDRAKKAAVWISHLTTEEWLLSLEEEGKRNRRRIRETIRARTGGSRI